MSVDPTVSVPCSCPGTPHPSDTVTLRAVLSIPLATAAMAAMRDATPTTAALEGALSAVWASPFAIESWSFIDDQGDPLPVTQDNITARLTWAGGGMEVVERADTLYAGDLFAPLARRQSKSSANGPTAKSISASPDSGRRRPKPSLPSSPNGTAGTASEVLAR